MSATEPTKLPLSSPERYQAALRSYVVSIADTTPEHRRQEAMDTMFRQGLPLGAILIAFKATEEEGEALQQRPMIVPTNAARVKHYRSMPYEQYLQTEHWQTVRRAALDFYEGGCQWCETTKGLHVHHRTYKRLGAERICDLNVLCGPHHRAVHGVAD